MTPAPKPFAVRRDQGLPDDPLDRLLAIMAQLRDPNAGCPWDVQQTFETIAPYTLEEAYEVADAIARGEMEDLKEELGDLLLQVVFHAQMAQELGHFGFEDVAAAIADKLIFRHPHVFGDENAPTEKEVKILWKRMKAEEKKRRAQERGIPLPEPSLIDESLKPNSALRRSAAIQRRCHEIGFQWNDPMEILDKHDEELAELKEACAEGDPAHIREEMGDALFTLVNFATEIGLEAEDVLQECNAKFERRFKGMESIARERGTAFDALPLSIKEDLWQEWKRREKAQKESEK